MGDHRTLSGLPAMVLPRSLAFGANQNKNALAINFT
jgi:hypothetical protein